MNLWNPWCGCKKYSEGCKYCYIHKGNLKRNIDTSNIVKTRFFNKPIEKQKNGNYKMKEEFTYLCFQSDFFIEEVDLWRDDCWKMIKERNDCTSLFLTKRILRSYQCIPSDWNDGYDNVVVCCTVENQRTVDERVSFFKDLPIKHKQIIVQPMIEEVNLEPYLDGIEHVKLGGESDKEGRLLDFSWVLKVREQCIKYNLKFVFKQCGTNFIKDGEMYHIPTFQLCKQSRLVDIDYRREIK